MKKGIKVVIGIVIIIIVVGLSSPLFYETEINEPLPKALDMLEKDLTYEKFISMDDKVRQEIVKKMPNDVKSMIMEKAATTTTTVSEEMEEISQSMQSITVLKSGEFIGLKGHNAQGTTKIIKVNEDVFLRFEDFQVTNGPDLRVYLTNNGDVKNGLHLDKLKGSKGNQNYSLKDIAFEKYDTVVIYCQPFGVHFGQAALSK